MRKPSLAFFGVVLLLPLNLFAYISPGAPQGFVNDFGGMLSAQTVTNLEQNLAQFEKTSKSEIAVVTVPTIGKDETIESFAVKLFEEWKIGKKGADNGLLMLIARDEKQIRIEVGYGLEPDVTDIESGRIISEVITPAFKSGDYDGGVTQAVARLEADIQNGAPVASSIEPQNQRSDVGIFSILSHMLYPILFGFMFLGSILGRSKSWWMGGVLGGIAGLVVGVFAGFFTGIFAALVLIPLGLLFDYLFSKHGGDGKGPRPPFLWLGGGGGGFGGGSGGGFGGFGGGRSGGGGASGGW